MKRRIIASSDMDQLGDVVSDISLKLKNEMIECGFDESDVETYYRVELEKMEEAGEYKIIASMELSYSDASRWVIPELDKIVRKIDPDAYFDCEQSGIWVCVLNVNGNKLSYKLNDNVVKQCVEDAVDLLGRKYKQSFDVLQRVLKPTKHDKVFNVFISIESETMQSKVVVEFDMNQYENKGAWSVESDLCDMIIDGLLEHMEQF